LNLSSPPAWIACGREEPVAKLLATEKSVILVVFD
jgi:hypothetical protein